MTRKEQNKILDDKIESNINQYKVDRLNAETKKQKYAFSSDDLNKYEFLTRKDLKYKPNALDKARFEFSPLGKAFSTGLDKTADGYQEEGVIKSLKDIRDNLAGGNRSNGNVDDRPNGNVDDRANGNVDDRPDDDNDDNDDNDNDDNDNDDNDNDDNDNDDNDDISFNNLNNKINNVQNATDNYMNLIRYQNAAINEFKKNLQIKKK